MKKCLALGALLFALNNGCSSNSSIKKPYYLDLKSIAQQEIIEEKKQELKEETTPEVVLKVGTDKSKDPKEENLYSIIEIKNPIEKEKPKEFVEIIKPKEDSTKIKETTIEDLLEKKPREDKKNLIVSFNEFFKTMKIPNFSNKEILEQFVSNKYFHFLTGQKYVVKVRARYEQKLASWKANQTLRNELDNQVEFYLMGDKFKLSTDERIALAEIVNNEVLNNIPVLNKYSKKYIPLGMEYFEFFRRKFVPKMRDLFLYKLKKETETFFSTEEIEEELEELDREIKEEEYLNHPLYLRRMKENKKLFNELEKSSAGFFNLLPSLVFKKFKINLRANPRFNEKPKDFFVKYITYSAKIETRDLGPFYLSLKYEGKIGVRESHEWDSLFTFIVTF